MTPLALIPAKGYSARLPRKNLRPLGGKPLLAWAIEAAQAAGIFADIRVSSESDDTLAWAESEFGANTLQRPVELGRPGATIADVVLHARRALEWQGPIYVLAPTNPFRSSLTIAAVWDRFQRMQGAALMSVSPVEHLPEHTFRFEPITGELQPVVPLLIDTPRESLQRAWRTDGAHVLLGGAGRTGPALGFETDPIEAVDINTADDLAYAEYLLATGRVPWISTPTR